MSDKVFEEFRANLESQDLAAKTIRGYMSDLRLFVVWFEEWTGRDFDLAEVATPTITRYRAELQNKQRKPTTINRALIGLKKFFAWAEDERKIERSPAKKVKLVPEVKPAPRHITDKEEAALMGAVQKYGGLRDKAILTVMLHTGVRAMELCNLMIGDVVINPRSGSLNIRGGKGNKFRVVPLNITARRALTEYMAEDKPKSYLFPSTRGGRLGERALSYIIKKYAHLAKVHDVSPHDLRHRFGYRMTENGTALHRLAQIMGHNKIDTTAIYVQATQADLQKEVEKLAWE